MKRWRSPRDPRVWLFAVVAIVLGALASIWAARILGNLRGPLEQWNISLQLFVQACIFIALLLAALVAVGRALTLARLWYEMDRNAVYVVRGGRRYAIPLDRLQDVAFAPPTTARHAAIAVQQFGSGAAPFLVHATTAARQYRLAVVDREQFVHELEGRRRLGVVQPVREGWLDEPTPMRLFLRRPVVRVLLGLTLALNLVLWGVLMWRYPSLPETVPLRFDPIGGTAGTRPKTATLFLPFGATLWLTGNIGLALAAARRSWLASELLLLGAFVLHTLLLIAAYFLLTIAG